MQKSSLRRALKVYPSTFRETVTFNSRQSADQSGFDSYTIFQAKRREVSDEEKLARGLVNVTALAWLLDADGLANAQPSGAPDPKPDDQIIDGTGAKWIISDGGVRKVQLGQVFECTCQLSVA